MRDDDDEQQLKIELLSQWKLEAEFRNFHPTLTANNSGLKPSKLKKYHIFGILRTSAFTWSYPGWVIPVQNFE